MSVTRLSPGVSRCWSSIVLGRFASLALVCAASIALAAPDAYAQTQGRGRVPSTFNVLPTIVTSVTPVGGQLVANGLVGTTPFQAPITLTTQAPLTSTADPSIAQATCPVLNLSLGPINLSLLGLNVDTSAICLDITAIEGGGLLGDLLCSVANLLSGGTPLADILAGLDPQQLELLNSGLTQVLNQAVFIPASSSDALQNATCEVLSLALGPLDLNLLGLRVELDDCMDGPVTVDVTATEGGGLLGDLLCSLAGVNNSGRAGEREALAILREISALLGRLLG